MPTQKLKSFPKNRFITATGIVVPIAWDVQGNPIRTALSTNDEREYMIDRRSRKGKEVATLLREQVQVGGILNNKGSILVKDYACIEY